LRVCCQRPRISISLRLSILKLAKSIGKNIKSNLKEFQLRIYKMTGLEMLIIESIPKKKQSFKLLAAWNVLIALVRKHALSVLTSDPSSIKFKIKITTEQLRLFFQIIPSAYPVEDSALWVNYVHQHAMPIGSKEVLFK